MTIQEYYSELLKKQQKALKAVAFVSLILAAACALFHPLSAALLCGLSIWAVLGLIVLRPQKKTPS